MSSIRDRLDKELNGMHHMMFEMLDEMSEGTKVAQSAQHTEQTATELATSRLDKMKDIQTDLVQMQQELEISSTLGC